MPISLAGIEATWGWALCFLVAILLLDLFDISLPRGDSIGVAGAVAAAGLIVLGPAIAAPLAMGSAVIAHVVRRGIQSPRRLLGVLLSRMSALAAATATLLGLPQTIPHPIVLTVVPMVYLLVEVVVSQAVVAISSARPFVRLLRGNLNSQLPSLLAQWSASVLLTMLLTSTSGMGLWSLLPVVALLLLMRQSYALFLDIRETYRTTVEVLVEAAEGQDERRLGHADRTAVMARSIAAKMGLPMGEVERISYAALLHDLGELSEESLGGSVGAARHVSSAEVVKGVAFFKATEPILRVCDGSPSDCDEKTLVAALVVALATDIDAAALPRVAAAHRWQLLDTVAPLVPQSVKARAVGAALELGYRIPSVG